MHHTIQCYIFFIISYFLFEALRTGCSLPCFLIALISVKTGAVMLIFDTAFHKMGWGEVQIFSLPWMTVIFVLRQETMLLNCICKFSVRLLISIGAPFFRQKVGKIWSWQKSTFDTLCAQLSSEIFLCSCCLCLLCDVMCQLLILTSHMP
jgi:hypothetical protein